MKKRMISLFLFLAMVLTFLPAKSFAGEKTALTALHITGPDSVTAGTLPAITAEIAAGEHAYVEYRGNTLWMYKEGGSWVALNDNPAVNDGFTHYAMRLCVNVESGYEITETTKIYYNGTEVRGAIMTSIYNWGAYVCIDLGTVKDKAETYDYYVDSVQITEANKDDVLGDGTVTFFEKGEFDPNCNVILLEDFNIYENSGLGYHKYNKDEMAAMYFGEDTIVILLGANFIMGDEAYDGIVTGDTCKLQFMGDGMLYVDVGTENTALFAPGGIVTVSEEAEVNLFGYEALNLSYTDENVVVKDNASLYCYAYQRNNGYDGTGLIGKGVTVMENGEFTASCQYNGDAIFTWVEEYSSSDYDIKILKQGEYQNAQFSYDKQPHQPYLLTNGLNTVNGIGESECRYINIKVKPHIFLRYGDLNKDGSTDSKDVMLLKRAAAGQAILTAEQFSAADVNHDGVLDSKDVLLLKRAAAGLTVLR